MLGKSASWVSNRLSLITRLDGNVYKMVSSGLLDPRSAQEVARLPSAAQYVFAEAAVREGLPKSAIESLVAAYNDESCPDEVKKQILSTPRKALMRMTDKRRAVNAGWPSRHKGSTSPGVINAYIKSVSAQMAALCCTLDNELPFETMGHALKELETELFALLAIVRKLISPGKTEEVYHVK
jgi:hypothetical protein